MRGHKRIGLILAFLATSLLGVALSAFAQAGGGKVLVLPFAVNAPGDKEALRKSVNQLLVERLKQQGVAVVDSAAAAAALKGKKDITSVSEARQAARTAGASAAIFGTVNQAGDAISIDAKSVAVSGSGEPAAAYVTRPGVMALASAIDELAQKLKPDVTPSASGDKVVELDVEGNNALEKDVVLLKVKTQAGEPYDTKTVNDDLKRLYELGYFEDVQIRIEDARGGKRVVFVVKEKPRIQAVSVVGNSEIKKDDILEAMGTKTGSVLNMQVLADDLEKVRELYRKKGYYQTSVEYKLEQTDPRMARLNIVVKEAQKLYIKKITIQGAKQVDPSDLKDQMGLKEKGFLSWLLQTGVLKEELLDRDSAAIENYYTNRGFIDARVGQPQVDIKDDGIYITVQVEEGDRYKVGNVDFKGDLLLDDKKLRETAKLTELAKKKEFFDRSVVRDDITRLNELYSDQGYAFAETDIDMNKRGEEKIVDVVYNLKKGQKVYVRRVTVEGNDRTRENVIRRELRLSDGDLFSGTKLKRSNERLNKLDYFEKVDVETVPTENPTEVDVRVKVKDKNTGSISAGVGYSTYDSVFVGGSVTERNLFGKGYNAQFQGMFSGVTNRFVLSFTNPAIYDSNVSGGVDAFSTFRRYSDYYKQSQGAVLRFGYPLGEYTTLRWDYRLTRDDVYHTNINPSYLIQESKGIHWTSSVLVGAARDTTDSRTKPTKGTLNDVSLEYAGLGGDRGFIKAYYSFNYYYPLFWETVFHVRAQTGFLFENGFGDVPVFERFYLGGIGNVRGYETDKISPKDHRTNERIGGDTTYFTNIEYIFPISKQYGVYGLGFFDAGNSIWRMRDGFDLSFVKSIGAGVRWFSPMGLIRVEAGYGLDEIQHSQQHFQIGFTMGNTF
ncbi:MAG: outer membrane protein assembly factor BamA [Desulfovibrio sp.]|nr:outer membrane protein assembly factor BamA [Desulfovibrio sp.]MBI4960491.1 outer membrane protein assembly factor BamA [Desulfovibrio sp.]